MQTMKSSLSNSKIQVRAGDRWLLVGTSGSGKTTAAKYLDRALCELYPFHRHYILDSKHDGDFDKYPGIVKGDMAPARPKSNQRYQVWQPIRAIPDQIEQWLWMIRQDATSSDVSGAFLFIDELVTLCYKRNQYSDEYNILQKTGRSLPVGSVTLTQELSKIPGNAYKQSVHRLGFYLDAAAEYDRRISHSLLKGKVADP